MNKKCPFVYNLFLTFCQHDGRFSFRLQRSRKESLQILEAEEKAKRVKEAKAKRERDKQEKMARKKILVDMNFSE